MGKKMIMDEIYEPPLLCGRFLLHVYKKLGVIMYSDFESEFITPEDFATSTNFGQAMRNPMIVLSSDFAIYNQITLIL